MFPKDSNGDRDKRHMKYIMTTARKRDRESRCIHA